MQDGMQLCTYKHVGQSYQVDDGGVVPGAHAIVALVPGPPVERRADEVVVGVGDGRHRPHRQ